MRAPEFWRQNGFLPAILTPVSHVWAWWTNRRLVRSRPFHSGVPVICIGNVVAGGAGKTPVALDVMERLISRGIHAGFLSRGYGGKLSAPTHVNPASHSFRDVGDEPLLLAAVAPTWTGKDRSETARIAIQSGVQAFVMDDGLQNPTLQKDISILVVDGQQGLGNGRVIPAGPLREPLNRVIERVQAIVVIGKISESLNATLPDDMPVLQARFVPDMIDDDISGKP